MYLKKDIEKVNYSDSISVSMIDGSLIARLKNSKIHLAEIKRVNLNEKEYLFYYLENSKWDELTTGDREVIEILAHEISSVVDEGFLKEQIDDTSTAAPVCLQHLIENQIVSLPQPGQVAFTLPYFREFAIKNEARIA